MLSRKWVMMGLCGALLVGSVTVVAADPQLTSNKATPTQTLKAHVMTVNPHLHVKPAEREIKEKTVAVHSGHWVRGWSYTNWATLHRGLGTIQGTIENGAGQGRSGIRVALRTAKGRVFRSAAAKHVTSTTSGGQFTMTNVRIGNYRVRASEGKASSHTGVQVHTGLTSQVHLTMR